MLWIALIVLLAVVVGVGTLLEAAAWVLLVVAALISFAFLGLRRVLPH